MRVALDTSAVKAGGVSRHMIDLATGLQRNGVDVLFSVPAEAADIRRAAAIHGIEVCRLGVARADIVHVHLANTFDSAAIVRMARYRRRSRIVATEHLPHSNASDSTLPYGGTKHWRQAAKTHYKRAQLALVDATVVPSRGCLDFMADRYGLPRDRLRLVPHGIPEPQLNAREGWGGELVIASGTLSVQKGFDTLVRAAAKQRAWRVEIYGEGAARAALEALIAESRAPARLMGWRDPSEIRVDRAALVCVPSRWEAFGYVALEAMWAAAPVVATQVDGLSDLVVDGQTGLLVPPGAESKLGAAISRVHDDLAFARRLGEAGRKRASEHFSHQAMIDGTRGVYADVLNR